MLYHLRQRTNLWCKLELAAANPASEKLHFPSSSQKLYSLEIKIRDFFFAAASLKIKAQNCLPQDWLLVGNPEVGNSWLHLCKLQTRMH